MSKGSKRDFRRGAPDKIAESFAAMRIEEDEYLAEYLKTIESEWWGDSNDFCDDDLTPAEELAAGKEHMQKLFGVKQTI